MKSMETRNVLFGELTYQEIRERANAGAIAIVPTGCTEQQGPHLSVDFDTHFAAALMTTAAKQASNSGHVDCVVLPALPFGPTPEHRGYETGYIDVPEDLHPVY